MAPPVVGPAGALTERGRVGGSGGGVSKSEISIKLCDRLPIDEKNVIDWELRKQIVKDSRARGGLVVVVWES